MFSSLFFKVFFTIILHGIRLIGFLKVEKQTIKTIKRKWVLATNSDFLTPISLEPDVVHLWFSNYEILLDLSLSLKYQRFETQGSKDIGVRKSEFVAKT